MTKADFTALQNDAKCLALDIGLRPAARALGLSEDRVRKWSSRGKWQIAVVHPTSFAHANKSPAVTTAYEAKKRILAQHRDRTVLAMAQSSTKVFEHLAEEPASALVKPASAISAQQWSKVADVTHGYAAERTAAPVVQIANVVLPSDEERADRRAMHARLDDIARRLKGESTP